MHCRRRATVPMNSTGDATRPSGRANWRPRRRRRGQPFLAARLLLHRPAPFMSTFRNRLLNALPTCELERLTPHLERVPLVRRMVAYDPLTPIESLYFVETGLVSIVSIM